MVASQGMRARVAVSLVFLAGCIGKIGDRDEGAEPLPDSTAPDAAPLPLSHLTRAQYDRTVVDLLRLDPLDSSPSASFPKDESVEGFAIGLGVSTLLVDKQQAAAQTLATRALAHLDRIVPCTTEDDDCARQFIDELGLRAYRRPVSNLERDNLLRVYQLAREEGAQPFSEGVRLVIEAILVSPHFLYHWPTSDGRDRDGLVHIEGYELASRLSYFLCGSMPSDALLEAAGHGNLQTTADVEREARAMLADGCGDDGIRAVLAELFDIDRIAGLNRNQELFPDFDAATARDLSTSLAMTLEDAFHAQRSLAELLTESPVFLNERLAAFYGVEGVAGEAFVAASFDEGAPRAGLLSHPALLALLGKFSETDPVHRGLFVWKKLLCREMAPPPPDVVFAVPTPAEEPGKTTRERYQMHQTPACAGCHGLIDPLGFAFEHYDAVGRYRDDEGGVSIDTTGTVELDGAAAAFDGVAALSSALAGSEDTRACWVEHWMRAAVRRGAVSGDDARLAELAERFAAESDLLAELAVLVVTSDAFLLRRAPEGISQ